MTNSAVQYSRKLLAHCRELTACNCCCCVHTYTVSQQVLLNKQMRTTVGLSFDYQIYNLLGFACYTLYTAAFYWSDAVQTAYSKRHSGNTNKVAPNDVAFALHAEAITLITLAQIVHYDWSKGHRPSRTALLVCSALIRKYCAVHFYITFGVVLATSA
jgi:cystinosin